MLPTTLYTLLAAALGASALAGKAARADTSKKLIIGGGPTVGAAEFNGTSFDLVAKNTITGTSATWLLFKEPNLLYAVDANSNNTRLFNFDPDTNDLTLVQNATGSKGVAFLEFTKDKAVMVGAAYKQGSIDVWDLDQDDGTMTLRKQINVGGTPGPVAGRQDSAHPHQMLLDPTGAFFVAPDLGTDSLIVIDSTNFDIQSRTAVTPAGAGPRHGAFFPFGTSGKPTHYFLACEIASLVKVFELEYTNTTINFTEVQSRSTFGAAFPPADPVAASAGELVIDPANKNLYVSNRLTGNTTDSISHFSININDKDAPLTFVDQVSSGGVAPRMFSLASNDDVLFSTNQDSGLELLALTKDATTGSLTEDPVASVDFGTFTKGKGLQFVVEIGSKGSNIK